MTPEEIKSELKRITDTFEQTDRQLIGGSGETEIDRTIATSWMLNEVKKLTGKI